MSYKKELDYLFSQKPVYGTPEELERWRKKVKAVEKKYEKEHQEWVKKIEEQWRPGEWEKMRDKLEALTLKELRELTDKVGIEFAGGNEQITNKEEFILVLDEADKKELFREYDKIIKKRKKF